jgi:hypothetical protein
LSEIHILRSAGNGLVLVVDISVGVRHFLCLKFLGEKKLKKFLFVKKGADKRNLVISAVNSMDISHNNRSVVEISLIKSVVLGKNFIKMCIF